MDGPVSTAILVQSPKNISISIKAKSLSCPLGLLAGSTWSDRAGVCMAPAMGEWVGLMPLWAGQGGDWRVGCCSPALLFDPGSCEYLLWWCFWAFVVIIFVSSLEGTAQRGKTPGVEERSNYSGPFVCG